MKTGGGDLKALKFEIYSILLKASLKASAAAGKFKNVKVLNVLNYIWSKIKVKYRLYNAVKR